MHLLVIEDERALCETIVRSLRRLPTAWTTAMTGKALALLGVERYDLVLRSESAEKGRHDGAAHPAADRPGDAVLILCPQRSGGQGAGARCRGERLSGEALPLGGVDAHPQPDIAAVYPAGCAAAAET